MNLSRTGFLLPKTGENNWISKFLAFILFTIILVSPAPIVNSFILHQHQSVVVFLLIDLSLAVCILLNKKKHLRIASVLSMVVLVFLVTYIMFIGSGIHDTIIFLYALVIIIGAIILSKIEFILTILLIIFSLAFVIYSEITGIITTPFSTLTSFSDLPYLSLMVLLTALSIYFLAEALRKTIQKLQLNEQSLEKINLKLQQKISQQQQTELALRESENKYKSLVINSPGVIYRCLNDESWTMIYMSDEILNLTGYEASDFINNHIRSWASIAHPDDANILTFSPEVSVSPNKTYSLEYRIVNKEERVKWVHEKGQGIFDDNDNLLWLEGVIMDITETKQTKEELKESQYLIQQIVSAIPGGVYVIDITNSKIIFTNNYLSRILGYNQYENEVDSKLFLELIHPDDKAQMPENMQRIFSAKDGEVIVLEYRIISKAGEWRWFQSHNMVFNRNKDGKTLQLLGIAQEITQQKNVAVELHNKNEELEKFTYTVSHDLRSPLVTIQAFTGYLEKDYAEENSDAIKSDIEYIKNASSKMNNLLTDLLNLSRIGKKSNPPTAFELKELVEDVLNILAGRIQNKGVEIKITQLSISLLGDKLRITELYQNLIENALKFSDESPHPKIEIGAKEQMDEVILFVKDNGIGISAENISRLFRLFEKIATNQEGSGIGLAIVKRIVETHGGRIWAESKGPGTGTTIYFTIPNTTIKAQTV